MLLHVIKDLIVLWLFFLKVLNLLEIHTEVVIDEMTSRICFKICQATPSPHFPKKRVWWGKGNTNLWVMSAWDPLNYSFHFVNV